MAPFLSTPLIQLSDYDYLNYSQLCESIFATGSPGSGKTSSLLKNLLLPMMLAKHNGKYAFSFLIHCSKPDERVQYTNVARMAGRPVKVLSLDDNETWDPVNYEFSQRNDIEAAVETINSLMTAAKPVSSHTGTDRFFEGGAERAVRACIVLLHAAGHVVNMLTIAEMLASLPVSVEQFHTKDFQASSKACQILKQIPFASLSQQQQDDVDTASEHLFQEWPRNDPKTTGSIAMAFLVIVDKQRYDNLRRVFCSGSTFRPEDIIDDRQILIADFPMNKLGPQTAKQLHTIVKQPFLRAVLRRPIQEDTHIVVNWADEFQLLVLPPADGTSRENAVLQIARSQRLCTTSITQSASQLAEALGENSISVKAHGLLGNYGTKIFFQNNDVQTNKYAADLIGHEYRMHRSVGVGQRDVNVGGSEQRAFIVEPNTFATLRRAGPESPIAEAIIHQSRPFECTKTEEEPEGRSYLLTAFHR